MYTPYPDECLVMNAMDNHVALAFFLAGWRDVWSIAMCLFCVSVILYPLSHQSQHLLRKNRRDPLSPTTDSVLWMTSCLAELGNGEALGSVNQRLRA